MSIFISEKRTQTGGKSPKPAVYLTCGSYEETDRLASACQSAGIEITWTLPDLDNEADWNHASRLHIQGKCRVDRMARLRSLVEELYERTDALIEIPDEYYQTLIFLHKEEVWKLCFEGDFKQRKKAVQWLTAKKRWLLTQILELEFPITSPSDCLTSDSSEETYEDLKNLLDRIENLDPSHCSRVKLRISRRLEREIREQERIAGEVLG